MKKLFLAFLFLTLAIGTAYAVDYESAATALFNEHDYGRSVANDSSELITIWHTGGTNGGFGVSGTTASGDLELVFYEDGAEITATRFEGTGTYARIQLDPVNDANTTCSTVEKVVNLINSDTSDAFHAAQGRDASPGTTLMYTLTGLDVLSGLAGDEDTAISSGHVLKDDTSASNRLLAGVRGRKGITNRLKEVAHNVKGDAAGEITDGQASYIRVFDGNELAYMQAFDSTSYATATATTVTPGGSEGLAAHSAKSLCISVEKAEAAVGTAQDNSNISIVVGDYRL